MNRFLAAIERHVRERPAAAFCHFVTDGDSRPISWRELGRAAGGFAAAYRAHGVAPGGIVAIFPRHGPALHAAFFGAMAMGGVPTILACPSPRQDPAIYWASLRRLLAHLDPAAIVLDRRTLGEMRAAGLAIERRRVVAVEDVPREGDWPAPAPGEDSLALVQHSSGTTGLKKGVALGYRAIVAQLEAYGTALRLGPADRIVSWLPLYHDMGLVTGLLLPAYFGIPVVQLDPFDWVARPTSLLTAIEAHRGTLVWQPDFAFQHIANDARVARRFDLSSMRAFINCAEPCRAQSFARFLVRCGASGVRRDMLWSCYAMAEAVFAVSQTAPGSEPGTAIVGDPPRPAMNLGRPIAGVEVSIRGRDFRALPEGEIGEIALKGSFLLDGYFRRPGLTAARIRAGWYLSRDLGCLIDGQLHVTGRRDDMLIVNGRNHHAGEIEALVGALGLTRPGRAAAFTLHDARHGGNGLIVVAEPARDGARDDDRIAGRIAAHLHAVLDIQPRDVRLVPRGWVVKTTSGKVSRHDNREKYLAAMARTREMTHAAP